MKEKIFKVGFWIMLPLLVLSVTGIFALRKFVRELVDVQIQQDSIITDLKAQKDAFEAMQTEVEKNQSPDEKYQAVKIGMPLKQVIDLLGTSFKELSRSEYEGYSMFICQWDNNSSTILITFMNGKVMTKNQN